MVFGVVKCFQGPKSYFLSESELKWIVFESPWHAGRDTFSSWLQSGTTFPIFPICAFPLRPICFLMSSDLTCMVDCCKPPTPKKNSESMQLSIKHCRCAKFCQLCAPQYMKALQQSSKRSLLVIHRAVVDARFDPPCVPPQAVIYVSSSFHGRINLNSSKLCHQHSW